MPKVDVELSPIDETEGSQLRAKLAMYRKRCLDRPAPLRFRIQPIGDARLREIMEPLMALAPDRYREMLTKFLAAEQSVRAQRVQETFEFKVLRIIVDLAKNCEADNFIATEVITDTYNRLFSGKKPTTSRTIGNIVSRLRFSRTKKDIQMSGKRTTLRGWFIDPKLLGQLKEAYKGALADFASSESSESSPPHTPLFPSKEEEAASVNTPSIWGT
jgi:hypothetical protein